MKARFISFNVDLKCRNRVGEVFRPSGKVSEDWDHYVAVLILHFYLFLLMVKFYNHYLIFTQGSQFLERKKGSQKCVSINIDNG